MEIETRQCNKCKENFEIDQNDKSFYEKMKVPVPHICPDCRFKMRAMWRNENTLYSGQKCGLCGKNIVTMYNPKLSYKIYCFDCFYSDKWDARDYAINYDFSKSITEQMGDLLLKVPRLFLNTNNSTGEMINSEYTNYAGGQKNCYLTFNADPSEEVLYSRGIRKCFDSMDLYFSEDSSLCYEGINTQKSSNCVFSTNTIGCVDCFFILNGSGLINCFGCVNLRNKSYCWFNEQLSPEEYKEKLDKIKGSYSSFLEERKKFKSFCLKFPHKENNNMKSVDCEGDYLFNCKNVINSFESSNSENCKYIFSAKGPKDSYDVLGFGMNSELLLETSSVGLSSNVIASCGISSSSNIAYIFYGQGCSDCFACASLKNGKYCILNKQYSKEEYEKIKGHIIKELTEKGIYGLMMPVEIAPFAYNETIAQDNMPLTKEEAITQGFRWEDDIQMTKGRETLQPEEIPDHIKDIKDSITKEILRCINCERNYKITEQELLFYRKMVLPIPHQCFYCRYQDRIKRRGPYKFWKRKCDHCGEDIKTNYSPDRKEIVYCTKCYQQEFI